MILLRRIKYLNKIKTGVPRSTGQVSIVEITIDNYCIISIFHLSAESDSQLLWFIYVTTALDWLNLISFPLFFPGLPAKFFP